MIMTTELQVEGMSCGHCVNSVKEAVTAVPGVKTVQVSLAQGTVTIESETPLDVDAVTAAISEAGYSIVTPTA
jgi:copper chaperone